MPVFFVHDASRGIVTPLDRKFRLRTIEETSELEEVAAIHPKSDTGQSVRANRDAVHAYSEMQENNSFKTRKTVNEIMSHPVLSISIEKTLSDAWQQLSKYEIHHLAILDEQQSLCGMLSDRDMLSYLMSADADPASSTPLGRFCHEETLSTTPDCLATELAEGMLELGLTGVPVVDAGQLVGIVTHTDLMKLYISESIDEPA